MKRNGKTLTLFSTFPIMITKSIECQAQHLILCTAYPRSSNSFSSDTHFFKTRISHDAAAVFTIDAPFPLILSVYSLATRVAF